MFKLILDILISRLTSGLIETTYLVDSTGSSICVVGWNGNDGRFKPHISRD
jgi:hypothetical protein